MFKKIWNGWKRFALVIGRFNTRVVLTVLYFILLGPFALLRKIGSPSPEGSKGNSCWQEYPCVDHSIEGVRRQY
jgi:hypothetical protein